MPMLDSDEVVNIWNGIVEKMQIELDPPDHEPGATVVMRYPKGSNRELVSALVVLVRETLDRYDKRHHENQ